MTAIDASMVINEYLGPNVLIDACNLALKDGRMIGGTPDAELTNIAVWLDETDFNDEYRVLEWKHVVGRVK